MRDPGSGSRSTNASSASLQCVAMLMRRCLMSRAVQSTPVMPEMLCKPAAATVSRSSASFGGTSKTSPVGFAVSRAIRSCSKNSFRRHLPRRSSFSLHRYRADAPLIHWLHRIAVRSGYRCWKAQRSRPTHVAIEGQTVAAPAQRPNDAGDLEVVLDGILGRLSPRDRLVLTLMYLENHSGQTTCREWT